ncbi:MULTISPECIES: hypothetical protein [unclassified Streptomyces]|uniref:hypothetical protein n=1 Tax=unclassified Streptomyces TaxID=2593676 RepID=UPI0038276948
MGVVVALAAGHLLGRAWPWRRPGDCAVGKFRSTGPWVLGGWGRQAVLILAHLLAAREPPDRAGLGREEAGTGVGGCARARSAVGGAAGPG